MSFKIQKCQCSWCGNRQDIIYLGEKLQDRERITECAKCFQQRVFFDVEKE